MPRIVEGAAVRLRVDAGRLVIPRRYWPMAHSALQAIKGRWSAHTGDGVMILSLEPERAEMLRQVLPADAVVTDPRGVGAS